MKLPGVSCPLVASGGNYPGTYLIAWGLWHLHGGFLFCEVWPRFPNQLLSISRRPWILYQDIHDTTVQLECRTLCYGGYGRCRGRIFGIILHDMSHDAYCCQAPCTHSCLSDKPNHGRNSSPTSYDICWRARYAC